GSAAVAAPGVGIYAPQPGGSYANISGTSASSAEVAGLAAMLAANGKSNAEAADQIRGAVDPIAGQSFGRINVASALGAQVAPQPTAAPQPTPTAGPEPTYVAGGAGDGSGSMTVSPTSVTAGSTGNNLVFTFTGTASNATIVQVAVDIPSGWTAPQV